ncbi:GNAT family N-acetyltransferase [Streptomyces sp. NPDC014636]|uniref:GNAT family N-acetyltransferase n=1 Tax=Streptomyces sp. NPDC014636 TaxID=3364876 RepID=UPI00370072B5
MTPVLRTERLEFLPYRPEHEDVFVALLRDEEVCRWMGQDLVPEPQIREVFRAILTDIYPRRRFDVWGLWLAGAYVGHAEVKPTGNVDGHELVTALAPRYWGHGLGGEAVRGLLRHAADNLGLSEAYGMVGAGNTASLAMCRRLGFRHVRDVVGDDGSVTKLLVIPTTDPGGPVRAGQPGGATSGGVQGVGVSARRAAGGAASAGEPTEPTSGAAATAPATTKDPAPDRVTNVGGPVEEAGFVGDAVRGAGSVDGVGGVVGGAGSVDGVGGVVGGAGSVDGVGGVVGGAGRAGGVAAASAEDAV